MYTILLSQCSCTKRHMNENRLQDRVSEAHILQMFNEGTISGPTDTCVQQLNVYCSHCICYPPRKLWQNIANGGKNTQYP
jgi:hypothetical protein